MINDLFYTTPDLNHTLIFTTSENCFIIIQPVKIYKIILKSTLSGFIKGTVSVISSDPPCKDGNSRFKTAPLKPLSVQ